MSIFGHNYSKFALFRPVSFLHLLSSLTCELLRYSINIFLKLIQRMLATSLKFIVVLFFIGLYASLFTQQRIDYKTLVQRLVFWARDRIYYFLPCIKMAEFYFTPPIVFHHIRNNKQQCPCSLKNAYIFSCQFTLFSYLYITKTAL